METIDSTTQTNLTEYVLSEDERAVFAQIDQEAQRAAREAAQMAAQPYQQQAAGALRILAKQHGLNDGPWRMSPDGTRLVRKD